MAPAGKNSQKIKSDFNMEILNFNLTNLKFTSRGVANSIIGGGGGGGAIFIYSCSALLISFEIYCFYGLWTLTHEYCPPLPNYWFCYATNNQLLNLIRKKSLSSG